MSVDVEPTAEVIDGMARYLEGVALELRSLAKRMREKKDLSYASEAVNTISSIWTNIRVDLLVTRPIRALTKKD